MDGIVGKIDWEGCGDCKNRDKNGCNTAPADDDLVSSVEEQTVKCRKYLNRRLAIETDF